MTIHSVSKQEWAGRSKPEMSRKPAFPDREKSNFLGLGSPDIGRGGERSPADCCLYRISVPFANLRKSSKVKKIQNGRPARRQKVRGFN
jgi:hypothetical protein